MGIRNPKILYQGQPDTEDTDLYTVPNGISTTITGILATNVDISGAGFDLFLLQNGDILQDKNILAKGQRLQGEGELGGGGIWTFEFPLPLKQGDKIIANQATANRINILVVGFEEEVV